jgi:hypothetical protein
MYILQIREITILPLPTIYCQEKRRNTFPARAHLGIKSFLPCIQAAFGHFALGLKVWMGRLLTSVRIR